jgi:hypothetical protein
VSYVNTPAGWYPDPNDPEKERYWDGIAWTAEQRVRNITGGPGSWSTPSEPQLGGLFDESDGSNTNLAAGMYGSGAANGRAPLPVDRPWWVEAEQLTDPTPAVHPVSNTSQPQMSRYEPLAGGFEQEAPDGDRRSKRKLGARGLVPRVGAGVLLLLALFLANAERERSEVQAPPVVDNLPTAAPSADDGFGAVDKETLNDGFEDPSALPSGYDDEVTSLLTPEPTPSPSVDSSTQPTPTRTASTKAPPMSRPAPVEYYGSAFGPGGLLAVSWTSPSNKSPGTRYLVELRNGKSVRTVRTERTEALFKNVTPQDCRVSITVISASGKSTPVSFRCGG